MQQIFVLVNQLLQREPATRKRKLCIRTYKVIPLSQRSGVVEWCEGTCPLGEYLIGPSGVPKSGAHARYRPVDWTSLKCRKKMVVNACNYIIYITHNVIYYTYFTYIYTLIRLIPV